MNIPLPNPPVPADPRDSMSQDELLMLHLDLQNTITKLKADEMDLRKYIVKRAFPNPNEGVNTLPLGNGYELKGTVKYNYKLDKDVTKIINAQERIGKVGNRGMFVADRLFSWKVDFLTTEYKILLKEQDESTEAKEILKIINEVLTIDEAAPELKIKEPKGKKS
jgi:hypothetical protein